ncbi:beta-ketoacyl reductase [Paenibacillus sp. P25]|nr:beta-ketoacyl reductase [Paenibacillus sp. P25]
MPGRGLARSCCSFSRSRRPLERRGRLSHYRRRRGLGLIFAEEIARRAPRPVLILAGRSPLSREKEARLNDLRSLGARVQYEQLDISIKEQADGLIRSIKGQYGKLNGVIHSSGVVRDSFLLRKTAEELHQVLAPKVTGLVNLDLATRDMPLDFFALFSSAPGSLGNPGQADYAAANAFMDAYAGYRNTLAAVNRRQGRTLSIGWPLWKEGGMLTDQETQDRMLRSWGMHAMETEAGIRVFYQGLASGCDRVLVVAGDARRIREKLLATGTAAGQETARSMKAELAVDPAVLKAETVSRFKTLFGEVAGMSASRIDIREPLESYGIDSILINQLNGRLEQIFGELSKTLFYEYQTLGDVIEHLLAEHPDRCAEWTGLDRQDRERSGPDEAFVVPEAAEDGDWISCACIAKGPEEAEERLFYP